jgi:hypothetical protein
MKFFILTLTSLALSLSLVSCSFSKDGGTSEQDRLDNDRILKIRAEYDAVVGLYQGVLRTNTADLPASFYLYTAETTDGKTSSGKTKNTPVLRGYLVIDGSLDEYADFNVAYDAASGSISLAPTTLNAQEASVKKIASGTGDLYNGKLNAKISGGAVGQLQVIIKERGASIPDDQAKRNRLIEVFGDLSGVYIAPIKLESSSTPAVMHLVPKLNVTGNIPYFWVDCSEASFGGIPVKLKALYEPYPSPAHIHLSTETGANAGGSGQSTAFCPISTFDGVLTPEGVSGTIVTITGKTIEAVFKRTAK